MNRIDRISSRLPSFYKTWDRASVLFSLLRSVSGELDRAEDGLTDMMKARWVDTASGVELDKLAALLGVERFSEEGDDHLRARLKRVVDEYKGGGTVSSILEAVRRLLNASEEEVKLVENPPAPGSAELIVRAGDTWSLSSESIEDAEPSITLTVQEGGEVSEPNIVNVDTGKSVGFKGKLGSNQRLLLSSEKVSVDGKEVPSPPKEMPKLLRRTSTWRYGESLGKMVGVFDTAKFDEQTFAVGVPPVKIRFDWQRLQPAVFEVRIGRKTLERSEVSKEYLERVVNSMKAAGVTAVIKISE